MGAAPGAGGLLRGRRPCEKCRESAGKQDCSPGRIPACHVVLPDAEAIAFACVRFTADECSVAPSVPVSDFCNRSAIGSPPAPPVGSRRTCPEAPESRQSALTRDNRGDRNARSFHLRCGAHPDRPLCRSARQSPHRRSRRRTAESADGAQSESGLVEARRGLFRLRQPGRRGQPQRRAHGAAAGRPARQRPGRDAQPAVRLGAQCGRRGRAGNPFRRHRFRDRRRASSR